MAVVTIRTRSPKAQEVISRAAVVEQVVKKTRALLSVEADRVLVVYGEAFAHIYYEDGQKSRS